jgi:hypothetical protein
MNFNIDVKFSLLVSRAMDSIIRMYNWCMLFDFDFVTCYVSFIIVIISLLMSPLLGHRPSLWITHKENGP